MALLGWPGQALAASVKPFPCPLPEVRSAWLGVNGPDAVAWLVVEARPGTPHPTLAARARAQVEAAIRCRPDLLEVDLTAVPPGVGTQQGQVFSSEAVMTLSAPRGRLRPERVWFADSAPPLPDPGPVPAGSLDWPLWSRLAAESLGGRRSGVIERGAPWSGRVALTLDDGPHPLYTPLLLAALRREGLPATFFLIGRQARAYPYFVHDMQAQGIEIGNHGYAHLRPGQISPAAQWRDLMTGQQVLAALTGRPPRFFRPPGGGLTPALLAQAQAAQVTLALWSDDPADYALNDPTRLRARLLRHLTRGGIVLLHDNAPLALDALPFLADAARERGLRVVTLGELLP